MLAHTDIHTYEETLCIYHKLNRYASYLIYVTLLVFVLGILTYGQAFSFREHAISHFGRIHTQDGSSNTLSLLIYSTGMLLSSLICLRMSNITEGRNLCGYVMAVLNFRLLTRATSFQCGHGWRDCFGRIAPLFVWNWSHFKNQLPTSRYLLVGNPAFIKWIAV